VDFFRSLHWLPLNNEDPPYRPTGITFTELAGETYLPPVEAGEINILWIEYLIAPKPIVQSATTSI
jgi:hypothetical protein